MVYADRLPGEPAEQRARARSRCALGQIARETGGEAFFPTSTARDAHGLRAGSSTSCGSRYTLGYVSANPARRRDSSGRWRCKADARRT